MKEEARNDLPCTKIDNLVSSRDLSTTTEQFITYHDGSFDYTGYLYDPMQPFGCIESLVN